MNYIRRILFSSITFSCLYISGCSVPITTQHGQINAFTDEKIKLNSQPDAFILVRDFYGNEVGEENRVRLKKDVEKYISTHNSLGDKEKNNLRELKVVPGNTKEEVGLLLGKPFKVLEVNDKTNKASELWIYRKDKIDAFLIFILPVFFTHDSYYLYFDADKLNTIEEHYIKQAIEASPTGGNTQKKK